MTSRRRRTTAKRFRRRTRLREKQGDCFPSLHCRREGSNRHYSVDIITRLLMHHGRQPPTRQVHAKHRYLKSLNYLQKGVLWRFQCAVVTNYNGNYNNKREVEGRQQIQYKVAPLYIHAWDIRNATPPLTVLTMLHRASSFRLRPRRFGPTPRLGRIGGGPLRRRRRTGPCSDSHSELPYCPAWRRQRFRPASCDRRRRRALR